MERFKKLFNPENYQLKLAINKEQETLSGICTITGQPEARQLKFHAVEMQIDSVTIGDESCEYKYDNETLEVNLSDQPKTVSITVTYHKPLNKNMQGAYLSTYEYQGKTEKSSPPSSNPTMPANASPASTSPPPKRLSTSKLLHQIRMT